MDLSINYYLPNECLTLIFSKLFSRHELLFNIAFVCKLWRSVILCNSFWRELTSEDLELNSLLLKDEKSQEKGFHKLSNFRTLSDSLQKLDFLRHRDGQQKCILFSGDILPNLASRFKHLMEIRGNVEDSFNDRSITLLSEALPNLTTLHLISPNICEVSDSGILQMNQNLNRIQWIALKTQKLSKETLSFFFEKHGKNLSYFSFGPLNEEPVKEICYCTNLIKMDMNGFEGMEELISHSSQLEELLIDRSLPCPSNKNIFVNSKGTLKEVVLNHNSDHLKWLEFLVEAKVELESLHIFAENTEEQKLLSLTDSFKSTLQHLCITIKGRRIR